MRNSLKLSSDYVKAIITKKFGPGSNTALITLPSFDAKIQLFRACKIYNNGKSDDQPRMLITDFLTPRTVNLLKDIRGINNNLSDYTRFYAIFTYNGRIFVKHAEEDDPQVVRSVKEFTALISE